MGAALLVATTALSAGAGLYGSMQNAKAAKARGAYEQQIANQNARMAELQAADSIQRGNVESNEIRRKGKQVGGSQRASYSGQGVDVSSGTPANIQDETSYFTELDTLTAKNNAWREAWGYKTQASDYRFQGKYARLAAKKEAKNTLITGGLRFFGDLAEGGYRWDNRAKSKGGQVEYKKVT